MPLFEVTPFTLNMTGQVAPGRDFFPSASQTYEAFPKEWFDQRETVIVKADSRRDALAKIWDIYQNIDEDHLTPDGKQSMQCGDLVMISDPENITWWLCCAIGWTQVPPPK